MSVASEGPNLSQSMFNHKSSDATKAEIPKLRFNYKRSLTYYSIFLDTN